MAYARRAGTRKHDDALGTLWKLLDKSRHIEALVRAAHNERGLLLALRIERTKRGNGRIRRRRRRVVVDLNAVHFPHELEAPGDTREVSECRSYILVVDINRSRCLD